MQNNRLFVFHFPKKDFEQIELLGVHHSPMGGRATNDEHGDGDGDEDEVGDGAGHGEEWEW